MVRSAARTVDQYLAGLPAERRGELEQVRQVILRHLPAGYHEIMNGGLIAYVIPLERFPDTYNGQPLYYAALAAQKNFHTLYFLGPYGSPAQRATLEAAFAKAGKKMDMGKSCLHFKAAADLPLDTVGELIAAIPPEKWIAMYQDSRQRPHQRPARKKPTTKARKRTH